MSQLGLSNTWYKESDAILGIQNLMAPNIGETMTKESHWAMASAETFAADSRFWSNLSSRTFWTNHNSKMLGWGAKAFAQAEQLMGHKIVLHKQVFTPDTASHYEIAAKFIPPNLIGWPWGLKTTNEKALWPSKEGKVITEKLNVTQPAVPLIMMCDSIAIYTATPHRESFIGKNRQKAAGTG